MKTGAIITIIICLALGVFIGFNVCKALYPVGLFVVRPDVDFFTCAVKVHGNYQFYYEPSSQEFMFERSGERCFVNTMQFRRKYIEMYGRTNEVFVKEDK